MVSLNSPAKRKRDDGYSFLNSKRPRVDAIREFPSGCGAFATRIDHSEYEDYSDDDDDKLAENVAGFMKIDIPKSPIRILEGIPIKQDFANGNGKSFSTASKTSLLVRKKPMIESKPLDSNGYWNADIKVHEKNNKVKETLNLFRELFTKYKRDQQKNSKGATKNAYIAAAKNLQQQQKCVNTTKQLGNILGVEVGDKFQCRAELNVVGLHHQFVGGIDYMKKDGKILATSIVASGRYGNYMKSSDVLIYSGQGGNPTVGGGGPKDQTLERGNLALKNSMEAKTPIRVIRKKLKSSKLFGTRDKRISTLGYIYDGLYFVYDYRIVRGRFGKLIFEFVLKRIPREPKHIQGEVNKWKGSIVQKDISNNAKDDEPTQFFLQADLAKRL